MKRILLTGFGPFSDVAENPSEVLVRDLVEVLVQQKDTQFETQIFPVDYEKASKVLAEINFKNYDFVFQFGVAARRDRVSLERVALNWTESKIADNSGKYLDRQKINSSGTNAFFSPLDLAFISQQLNARWGENTDVSLSAGAYLCNFVYYKSRAETENCLFVHIPSSIFLKNGIEFRILVKNIALDLIQKIL